MKKFIFLSFCFAILSFGIFLGILSLADGFTDPYYLRFTAPKQRNLILGTSRSAQGLLPSVISKELKKSFYNFSFTMTHSPFGPVYYNFIRESLQDDVKNGVFIISVEPWSISSSGKNPNDTTAFVENNLPLGRVKMRGIRPNFEYLLKILSGNYYTVLANKNRKTFLHDDGWLEISVSMDSVSLKNRTDGKIKSYRTKNLPNRRLSTVRLEYLKKTVGYLKQHGKVFLVRMPISDTLFKMEQELMPNFNEVISPIVKLSDGYLDMTPENHFYKYTDGNHLWKDSGKIVSEKIARWVLGNRKK